MNRNWWVARCWNEIELKWSQSEKEIRMKFRLNSVKSVDNLMMKKKPTLKGGGNGEKFSSTLSVPLSVSSILSLSLSLSLCTPFCLFLSVPLSVSHSAPLYFGLSIYLLSLSFSILPICPFVLWDLFLSLSLFVTFSFWLPNTLSSILSPYFNHSFSVHPIPSTLVIFTLFLLFSIFHNVGMINSVSSSHIYSLFGHVSLYSVFVPFAWLTFLPSISQSLEIFG